MWATRSGSSSSAAQKSGRSRAPEAWPAGGARRAAALLSLALLSAGPACSGAKTAKPAEFAVDWTPLAAYVPKSDPVCPADARALSRAALARPIADIASVAACALPPERGAGLRVVLVDAQERPRRHLDLPLAVAGLAEARVALVRAETGDLDGDGTPDLSLWVESRGIPQPDFERRTVEWFVVRFGPPAAAALRIPLDVLDARTGDCAEDFTRQVMQLTLRSAAHAGNPPEIVGFVDTKRRRCEPTAEAETCPEDEPPPCEEWQRREPVVYRCSSRGGRYERVALP